MTNTPDTPDTQVIVRHYGLLAPLDWGDDCREQLFLENRLWNQLVEIERDHRARWDALFCQDADHAALTEQLTATQTAIDVAWEERRKLRAKLRAKATPEDEDAQAHIQALCDRRRELWQALKASRNALKPRFQAAIDALELDRRAQVKTARQQSGLFWSNYNAVIDAYQTARGQAMKTGSRLRFHAFDGGGRFVNQIQGGLSVADLFAGKHAQVRIAPVPDDAFTSPCRATRRRLQRTTLTVTAFTGRDEAGKHSRRTLTFPLVLHRPLPDDARIKLVEVVARQETGRLHWTVTFTCTRPAVAVSHASPAACGLNFGWRQTSAGLRVATLIDSRGEERHLHLGDKVIGRLERCERLQTTVDEADNAIRAVFKNWLDAEDAPQPWREGAEAALRSRAPHRLAQLAIAWRDWDWRPDWRAELEAWRKHNKRLRQEMAGLRGHALRHRRELYRLFAKQIADGYALIGVGQMNLKQAAQKLIGDQTENLLPAPARRLRQYAAVSELQDWLGKQVAKSGAQIVTAERPVTNTCHHCGERSPVPATHLNHQCQKCGRLYDRDINAAAIALQDAIGGSAKQKEKPPRKPRVRKREPQRPAQGLDD